MTNPSFGKWKVMNTREAWNYERKVRELAGATPAQLDAEYPDSLLDHGFDWVDATFKNGHTQQYEIVSSGGNDKTKYYLSAGYMKQQGAVIASDFERYSVVSNLQQQVNNRLDISLNLNLSYSTTNNAVAGNRFASPLIAAFSLSPMINPYKPDGSYYKGWEDEWPTPIGDNFLYSTPLNTNINYNFRGLGRISFGYKITDWLKFTQTTAVDMIFTRQKSFYDPTTSDAINLQEPEKSGSIFDGYQQNRAITSQTSLSGGFKWKRDERHEFDFLVMMEYQPTASLNFSAEGQGLVNGKLKVLNVTATPLDVGGAGSDYAFLGYIGQLNYTFNNRYYLTASGRIDGSSRFGADDRYKFFGSVGGSWRISDEPFMKNLAAINDLKLRVSYGTAGNAGFSDFGYKQLYAFGSSYYGAPGSRPSTIGNNELTWEQVATTDLGLEAAVLQSRISASIDLYQRVTTDMLLNVPISATSGFTTRPDNLGKLTNKGVEVTLSSQNLVGNFRWETEINYTLNRNKVNELYKNQDIISGNKIIRVGEPLNSWYMKKWAGVAPEDGDPLWYRADGKTTDTFAASNFRVLGNTQPKYTVGLTNNFSFKGITLSTFFYALKGNVAYNNTRRFSDGDGARFGWNYMKVAGENFWQKAGDIAERPKPVVNGNKLSSSASSRYLEDASYIRLRNVVLAYSLPKAALNALKLNGARVYAQGQNLLTFTKYLGVDPEVGIEGEEFFKYPVSKSYTVGLEITF
ncbi:SusC/RagA family TonB-linked outer membrane protein [Chitinophaga sedimenti]|uniref:SusC/RagA family TonB-linked outer membrane protein n=1 Tax=Chitinophaga sedimenti TaxID=2033606 RepID=UPI002003F610|nr:SusC/RagA family TonB-linked outer membrane protein [Chitinophaga sedimenti]MCK7558958.1 SusC/RagA family TonB-linked outer membrane protein [Chitinophaga sedimenti]